MKPFKNWDDVKAPAEFNKLPMGGYLCRIMEAEVTQTRSGDEMLVVNFDITDGEYKDYYANEHRSQQSEDKRWKGVIRYFLPKEDGSEKDAWTKSRFKAFTDALEESNSGYIWEWKEETLKGKKIGMVTRNEEWDYNGKTGFTVRPYNFVTIDKIVKGTYKLPKDKYLNGSAPTTQKPAETEDLLLDSDLPF